MGSQFTCKAKQSVPILTRLSLDGFVASLPRHDGEAESNAL
jgi:hypothetical protein